MRVTLSNDRTGELKEIKVGWSWTLLIFTQFLGIPLYLRKLNNWGSLVAGLCIFYTILGWTDGYWALWILSGLIILGLSVFFAIRGNEMTAKALLESGWIFAYPEDRSTTFAKSKWSLR